MAEIYIYRKKENQSIKNIIDKNLKHIIIFLYEYVHKFFTYDK